MILNPEQQAAVNFRRGACAVIAGPGSGKTRVLCERFKKLVAEGVNPKDILSITFTARAAEEMRKRAGVKFADVPGERPSGFRTFHSLGLAFVGLERDHMPYPLDASPINPPLISKTIGQLSRRYAIRYQQLASWISRRKRQGINPERAAREAIVAADAEGMVASKAYSAYEREKRELGILDFDDLLVEMVRLLERNAEVRERWCFKHILTDESQDCDDLNWRAVQLMSGIGFDAGASVFCVGDYRQSIYGWRGAHPELFLGFDRMFTGAQTLFLNENYRSSRSLVDFLNDLNPVTFATERFHTSNPAGKPPAIVRYTSDLDESAEVVRRIDEEWSESTAILARTNRYLWPFQEALAARNLRYQLLGPSGFWQQSEIKHVLKKLRALAVSPGYYSGSSLSGLTGVQLAVTPKLIHSYEESKSGGDNNPADNLRQLIKIAARYRTLKEFLDYAARASAASRRAGKSGLAVGTVHAAKGLEFDRVFLVGAAEGVLPHAKSEDLEEEQHILFVGCSRSARELNISYVGTPSRFLPRPENEQAEASVAA